MTYYVIDGSNSINNTTNGSNGLQLGLGDNAIILASGSVLETGTGGTGIYINAYATGSTVTVQGLVLGTQQGIYSLGQNATVNVNGTVYNGISMQGQGSTLNVGSSGYVSGEMALTGLNSQLSNDGTIDVGNGEFQIDNSTFINNHGTMTSSGILFGFNGAGPVYINNYGTMHGGFLSQDCTFEVQLTNSGLWDGFGVELSGGDDVVTNTGTMTGSLTLGAGNDQFDGSRGHILGSVEGGDGNDFIATGSEDNTISGGAGADTLDGGGGVNTLDYSSSALSVTVDLTNNIARHGDAAGDRISHFQNLNGSFKGDNLSGDATNNVIDGVLGNDTINGNAGDDTLIMLGKGKAHLNGGTGNDIILLQTADAATYGAAFTTSDQIDGGTGFDTLQLFGAANVAFTATTLLNVERIQMQDGFNYVLTTNDATVAAGQNLQVDASALTGSNLLNFNGSAELDGNFSIDGGDAKDTIVGGAKADTIAGNGNADTLTGGAGGDTFVYSDVTESSSTKYDIITDYNASADKFSMPDTPAALDAMVASGTLSTASFNNDMKNALNGHLLANDAILFHATAGTLSGHTFLVVDANGTAGYQSAGDYVMDITGYSGAFVIGDFV